MSKALGIAEERFARGEISEGEFDSIVSALQGGERSSPRRSESVSEAAADLRDVSYPPESPGRDFSSDLPPDMIHHYEKARYRRRLSGSASIIDWFISVSVLIYCAVFVVLFMNKDNPAAMNNWLDILGAETSTDETALMIGGLIAIPELIVMIAGLVWVYRATSNLFYQHISELSISPGWSVWWFFIPVAFLWMPVKVMHQLYSATLHQHNWKRYSINARIVWWWITFWVAGLFAFALPSRLSADNDAATTLGVYGIYCVVSIISILLFGSLVKDVTRVQNKSILADREH